MANFSPRHTLYRICVQPGTYFWEEHGFSRAASYGIIGALAPEGWVVSAFAPPHGPTRTWKKLNRKDTGSVQAHTSLYRILPNVLLMSVVVRSIANPMIGKSTPPDCLLGLKFAKQLAWKARP